MKSFEITLCCCIWMIFISWHSANGAQRNFRPPKRSPTPDGQGMICRDVDIRNGVDSFKQLENCTMIEGYLHILLIEGATQRQYENLYFPELREISDYLLLYRVYGLKTLHNIFPNLAVIRGQKLFFDYALVAYEMMDLEELGLTGLITIQRGAVRLEKNPQLCYVHTIDWTKIATQIPDISGHFFKGNKHPKECVNMCPADCQKTQIEGVEAQRCWSLDACQKILTCDARTINTCPSKECVGDICCHENCVGGCTGPTSMDCVACKNVINVSNKKTICAKQCLPGTYEYRESQCLKDFECMKRGLKLIKSNHTGAPGLCVLLCPNGYIASPTENTTCIKCEQCAKVCPAIRIDSVRAAQEVKGCTIIDGPLEIRIRKGSNIAQELEQNVGQIREIREYLWIHSSNALLSLSFFKKLEKIHGRSIHNGYALLVHDNSDLQELFPDEVAANLQILNGNLLFHYNRKLCLNKIIDFEKKVKMVSNKTKNDISETTNGDQMPCSVTSLNLTVVFVTSKIALLKWQNFKIPDQRQLLSYVVSYKEAPTKDVSIYEGRDACSDDVWRTRDVLNKVNKDEKHVTTIIVPLEPWTQYAVYVQTYTTASAMFGAISDIVYFRTAPAFPTNPANLKVIPLANGTLLVKWDPPTQPHGNVTHYEVYWHRINLEPEKFNKRDYCKEPLEGHDSVGLEEIEKKKLEEEQKNKANATEGQCSCPKQMEEEREEIMEREMRIKFEDYLHSQVYIKRIDKKTATRLFKKPKKLVNNATIGKTPPTPTGSPPPQRYRRESQIQYNITSDSGVSVSSEQNKTEKNETEPYEDEIDTTTYMKVVVQNSRHILLSNQGHFKDYSIGVIACQERDPRAPQQRKLCSSRALAVARTLPDETADNIDPKTIRFHEYKNRSGEVLVTWDEPKDPNGLIIAYEIRYKKMLKDVSDTRLCITHLMYKKLHGYILEKLEPGNYSVKICATSLAGKAPYTEPRYFKVSFPPGVQEWPKETIIAVAVSGVLLLILVAVIVVWFVARSRFSRIPETIMNISANPDYFHPDEVYVPDEWEVDRDTIRLIRELGQGSFGMVYEGIAHELFGKDQEIKVAVKTVNEHASFSERMSFLNEASTMKAFKCNHVVRLLGVVSQGQPAYVVMELMTNGDLKNFLRLHRPDEEEMDSTFAGIKTGGRTPPNLSRIIQMAAEIADGMAYLADKKYVHRDLAARNCMVAEDLTVKIGDFGMTRDIYETDYYRKGGKALLPVRWMAPESLKDGIFTSLSDVWSYGVVLWEMATLAAQPYQGLSNEEVLKYVLNGKVMDKPEGCPDRLFDLMLQCWRYKPKQRPTFKEIIEMLVPELDPSFKEVSYFFSDENKQEIIDVAEEYEEEIQDDSHVPFIQNSHSDSEATGGGMLTLSEDIDLDDEPGIGRDFQMYNSPPRYNNDNHFSAFELGLSQNNRLLNEKLFDRFKQKDPGYSSEHCDCVLLQETNHNTDHNHRYSTCSNPNSAIGSSDGSKDSSKSSGSGHAQRNGFNTSIANGHVTMHHPMRSAQC